MTGNGSADPTGGVFFDTNVLLYNFDNRYPAKKQRATAWVQSAWQAKRAQTAWQVLHEFYANAARKLGVPEAEARAAVRDFAAWPVADAGMPLLNRAWHWCDAAQVPFWDAMIVAAAEQSGSRLLVSEDFQDGRKYGALTVVNPFEHEPAEFAL